MVNGKYLVMFILVISLVATISASFEIGNLSHSIEKIYGPSGNLRGWVNISFKDHPSNSQLTDSFNNSMNLIEFLNKNENSQFTCSVSNCLSDYSATNNEKSKTFSLGSLDSKIVGFKLTGEIDSITSIDFTIESDASPSCYNQIKIDLLNDGITDRVNNKIAEPSCSFLRNYGCFNESENSYNINIGDIPYCQRVYLFESPGFKIGAWVKEEVPGNKKLKMTLYNFQGDQKGSCELLKQDISSGKEIYCNIDYSVSESKDYYVCINSEGTGGIYKTKGYSSSLGCGFNNLPLAEETTSYRIFAEGRSFASVGILNISNSLPEGDSLNSKVSNYIKNAYESLDCSSGCVVPIKIISGKSQKITLKELKVVYNKKGLQGITEEEFYDLKETPVKINAGFQRLYLDKVGFFMSSEYGNKSFKLNLDNEELFSELLFVEDIPIIESISPLTTAAAVQTSFIVKVKSNQNITKYQWDFGDNKTETSTTNKITHTYNDIAQYTLKVTVTDSKQRSSSKEFKIDVGSPKEIVNQTINEFYEDIENLKTTLNEFDSFSEESLNSILDLDSTDQKLREIKKNYEAAVFDDEYTEIMVDLLELNIPNSLRITKSAESISFYPSDIDLFALETIGSGSYDIGDEDKYIESILSWNQENIETKIKFEEISAQYKSYSEPILRVFQFTINEKKSLGSDPYFIILSIENLEFKEDYLENEESGYVFIKLTKPETIVFSTTEDVDFINVPAFISPALSEITINEVIEGDEEEFNFWLFIIICILILLIGVTLYVILQIWYKNKYENYLFKNKNDLYNLITFIDNSRKKGLNDKEITDKLKKSGWKTEQIVYALKKHSGKRTGMAEIPIGKILKKDKNIVSGRV
ncbi:MAG: PKD domain-containing protein [archaeon]